MAIDKLYIVQKVGYGYHLILPLSSIHTKQYRLFCNQIGLYDFNEVRSLFQPWVLKYQKQLKGRNVYDCHLFV